MISKCFSSISTQVNDAYSSNYILYFIPFVTPFVPFLKTRVNPQIYSKKDDTVCRLTLRSLKNSEDLTTEQIRQHHQVND